MGMLLSALPRRMVGTPGPTDSFWYITPEGFAVGRGAEVRSQEHALKISAMWRAMFILSNAGVASLPCITYRRTPDGGRERAGGMPIYDILHDSPNSWQTAPEYWDFVMRALGFRGNACSLIVPGRRGPVDQLIPMHPDRLTIVELPGNRIGYYYRHSLHEKPIEYTQDEVFHLRCFADGGRVGKSLLSYAAEDLGHAAVLARFGRKSFEKAPMLSGVLEVPNKLDDDGFRHTRESFSAAHGGPENWHSVAVLEQGTKFNKIGMTNEDAQFLASREFSIRDIARWTGVKKYLLEAEDTPSYNSIEAFQVEHVTYAIRPWCYAIEQGISRDLIMQPGIYFSEFLVDALMRGDPLRRAQKLEIERRNGALSGNEWRQLENRNRRDDADGDTYWGQPNLARGASSVAPDSPVSARALAIAEAAAARVVRRETAAVAKAAQRFAQDAPGFAAAVAEFYEGHRAFVSDAMGVTDDEARRYCTSQRGRIERDGLVGMETWAHEVPAQLAHTALMLESV